MKVLVFLCSVAQLYFENYSMLYQKISIVHNRVFSCYP